MDKDLAIALITAVSPLMLAGIGFFIRACGGGTAQGSGSVGGNGAAGVIIVEENTY